MRILTFDIEDWFHLLDNPETRFPHQWEKFESRINRNMDIIFEILGESNCNATFFIVGWIAEKYPSIVKKISELGYEIGSHTNHHQLLYDQTEEEFKDDLRISIDNLEQITGKKVEYFRAPGFSLTRKTPWVFDSLIENGIKYDSSIFPANRGHGGISDFKIKKPFRLRYGDSIIKEFPINTLDFNLFSIVFSGGGYFRLFPYNIIKSFTTRSTYTMSYFHPRDFDPNQPRLMGLSPLRYFKSYYGLKNTEEKLRIWLSQFDFIDIKEADNLINWEINPLIELKDAFV